MYGSGSMRDFSIESIKEYFSGLSARITVGKSIEAISGKTDNPILQAVSAVLEDKADELATRSVKSGKIQLKEEEPMQMLLRKKAEIKHAERLQAENQSKSNSIQI